MYPNKTPDFEASLWEGITTELYALGALALRLGRYAEMRAIVVGRGRSRGSEDREEGSWLRQGQTASARSTLSRWVALAL